MNINFGATKGMVVGKKETKSGDGKSTYYKLSIVIDGEAGMVSCSEEVYQDAQVMKEFNMFFTYNETYKSLSLKRILSVGAESSGSTGPTRPANK